MKKRLIVLTKSPMHKEIGGEMTSGACVVAFCPESRRLIRLTQEPNGSPLNGRCVRRFSVMDEIKAEVKAEKPEPPQNENVLIPTEGIYRLGRSSAGISEIAATYIAGMSARFMDDPHSVLDSVSAYDHSVEIVSAKKIIFVWEQGKRRPRVSFTLGNTRHISYRVTDPELELAKPAEEKREKAIDEAWLVVSIPNIPFAKDGKYYKFVAAVFPVILPKTESKKTVVKSSRTPEQILNDHFGYDSFRPGQREVISQLMTGRDSICVMPTGQGKSVCYQIPAMLLQGTTMVISPLIALMKDQVAALVRNGIPAAYLNSTLNPVQQEKVLNNIANGMYKLVYVTPERLSMPEFQKFCSSIRISLIAVDEAHCVSQWGPNFRYDYLNISQFIEYLPERPVVGAFTATATQKVAEDIIQRLALRDPFSIRAGFDRPNLYFAVLQPADKRTWISRYLQEHKGKSGIIYCATRKTAEQLYDYLSKEGYPVSCYHAGLLPEVRMKSQEDFLFDRTPVMTATNAFGMGIDKPNVSFVIHYNIPKSMEAYYQEAGRAGRDGTQADCIVLYSRQDLVTNRRLIEMEEPSPDLTPEEADHIRKEDLRRLNQMADFAEGTECLRAYILKYFGETDIPQSCGNCSNCKGEFELMDIRREAQIILSCVARTGQKFGRDFIAHILKGKTTERHEAMGMEKQTTWGMLSDYSFSDINRMITALISREYLASFGKEYPVLKLTGKSRDVLFSNQPLMIRKIDAQKGRRRKANITAVHTEADNQLYELLRKRRNEEAEKEGVPPYVILDNKTLMAVAAIQPQTEEEFIQIKGIGKVKTKRYASLFLPIIREYQEKRSGVEDHDLTESESED